MAKKSERESISPESGRRHLFGHGRISYLQIQRAIQPPSTYL